MDYNEKSIVFFLEEPTLSKVESTYQRKLVKRIEELIPGCFVLRNNPDEVQGIPDLLILFESQWAMLEVKRSVDASVRPNQTYYVDRFNAMSFCAFIYPEIEEEVLSALQSTLDPFWSTRLS